MVEEEVEGAGRRKEAEVEEGGGVDLEDLGTGSRMVEGEGEEEERMVLETGRGDQGGERRDLPRGMRGNLEEEEVGGGMIEARRNEKRSERRDEERGKAGGGRRPCLLTSKLHWLQIRRRRRGGKQISSRTLKALRRVERSRTEVCRSKMKSLLGDRRVSRPSLLQMNRCRRIQVEMELNCRSSRRRLQAAEKRKTVRGIRRLLVKREWK